MMSTEEKIELKNRVGLDVDVWKKTATIFRHRDAPERLESSETESSSEGSVFNAFHIQEMRQSRRVSALTLFEE